VSGVGSGGEGVSWEAVAWVNLTEDHPGREADLGIFRKVLTERLKWLIESGILERRQYETRPPRVH